MKTNLEVTCVSKYGELKCELGRHDSSVRHLNTENFGHVTWTDAGLKRLDQEKN